jgi:hypothetical protein
MKTSETVSAEIVKNGRVFRPVYRDLLNKMPKDIVQELAKRRLAEIEAAQKAASTLPK